MKAILLIAGLLGACNYAAADSASDTFLKPRMEGFFRNPIEFPETGFDILAAGAPAPEVQMRRVIEPEPQTELMRGATWQALENNGYRGGERNGPALWWLVVSTVLCLGFGCCVSAVGSRVKSNRQRRRRAKTTIRMMAGR